PVAVVRADRAAEVTGALVRVHEAVRGEGLYAAGFVTYEAGGAFGLPVHEGGDLPLAWFALFSPECVRTLPHLPPTSDYTADEWRPSIDRAAYSAALARIKARIEAGDTYQINFTFRMRADFDGDPLALLGDLDLAQDGSWSGYVDTGRHAIASASPELFFAVDGDRILCRPMKGTAPRGLWPAADVAQAESLRASEKNRAENVMVVDMVRNDLGRIATAGSVEAARLFDVERYPMQWQMTSTVKARVPDVTLVRAFEALFPSGSITGAPKHSSMAIIRELEDSPRGIYTGAIGYWSPNGRGHFNVAIRTVAVDREARRAEFGVGSGIVWDSIDADEYDECVLKASIIGKPPARSYAVSDRPDMRLLETIGWTPDAGFALLDRHIARLRASAACFGYDLDVEAVNAMLENAVADLVGPSKLRILLGHSGTIVCEAVDVTPLPAFPLQVALARDPIDAENVFLYHKTTRRQIYEAARRSRPDADMVVLWNRAGEITEATDANVVVEIDGRKVTPPVECGLLAGTMRAALLESGEIVEQRVTVEQLRGAGQLWLINSVRGWMPATLLP
ncbi:MAG TPA: aminodeoxychorismate synthase component I, partial [Vicinamibacterales bacterium]